MKRSIPLFMTIVSLASLFFVSCEDSKGVNENEATASFPTLTATSRAQLFENALQKSNGNNGSIDDLSKFLAADKKWLKKSIVKEARKTGIPIDQLADEATTSLINLNGIDYTIKVELFNAIRANVLDQKKFSYGVALDPDLFYHDKSDIPVYYWNEESKSVEIRSVSLNLIDKVASMEDFKASRDGIEYPLFFVSLESDGDPMAEKEFRNIITKRLADARKLSKEALPCEDCGPIDPPPPPPPPVLVPYFVVKAINLTDKKDWTNDEFELYCGESISNSSQIYRGTAHKFNGNTRNDAASRSVYYRDVNGDQGWEIMSNDIAIWPLKWLNADLTENTGATMRILCVEDDYDAGKHDQSLDDPDVISVATQNYRMSNGGVVTTDWNASVFHTSWNTTDQDDIYRQSGIDENSKYLTPLRYNNTGSTVGSITDPNYVYINLSDVNWFVGVRFY